MLRVYDLILHTYIQNFKLTYIHIYTHTLPYVSAREHSPFPLGGAESIEATGEGIGLGGYSVDLPI
jgi:hypothetical protein